MPVRSGRETSVKGVAEMPTYTQGAVLTCTHEECDCRVVIERECTCTGVTEDSVYTCACGAPLVPVSGGGG